MQLAHQLLSASETNCNVAGTLLAKIINLDTERLLGQVEFGPTSKFFLQQIDSLSPQPLSNSLKVLDLRAKKRITQRIVCYKKEKNFLRLLYILLFSSSCVIL